MSIMGSPGSEDRKKFYAVCGFVVVVAVYLYFQYFRDPSTPTVPPPPVVVTTPASMPSPSAGGEPSASAPADTAAKLVGTTSAALDPTLHMDAMLVTESVAYEGTGRNIFSAVSAPVVVIPNATASARVIVKKCPPDCPPPPPPPPVKTCPPDCPPIDLRFCGYFESPATGQKRAILLHGDDQFLAYAGDIVMRRYHVISISAKSIEVEDMQNNNKQTLPLLANP